MRSLANQWDAWMESHLDNGIAARIKASWERCGKWGLSNDHPLPQHQNADSLAQRRLRRARLLPIADPHVTYLAQILGNKPHGVALSDEHGIVLRLFCDEETAAQGTPFFEGADWSEEKIGTNGIGTALRDRKPVVIFGPQHYCKSFHRWTGTAAPIITSQGNLLGAIIIIVPEDLANPCALNLVTTASEAIATAYCDHNLAGVMAASLVHEANNPLTVARGFVQLMAQADLPIQYTNYACMAVDAIDQTKDILNNFSNLLKTRENEPSPPVELTQTLEEVQKNLLPLARERNIALSLVCKAGNLYVAADARLLQRVWVDIIKNSLEAMEKGSIKILVTKRGNRAQIFIRDNGPGITPDIRSRLFEPFTTTKATGSGLGLVVCKEIISATGGSITTFCPARGGTTVIIQLPLAI